MGVVNLSEAIEKRRRIAENEKRVVEFMRDLQPGDRVFEGLERCQECGFEGNTLAVVAPAWAFYPPPTECRKCGKMACLFVAGQSEVWTLSPDNEDA